MAQSDDHDRFVCETWVTCQLTVYILKLYFTLPVFVANTPVIVLNQLYFFFGYRNQLFFLLCWLIVKMALKTNSSKQLG